MRELKLSRPVRWNDNDGGRLGVRRFYLRSTEI